MCLKPAQGLPVGLVWLGQRPKKYTHAIGEKKNYKIYVFLKFCSWILYIIYLMDFILDSIKFQ